MADTVRLESSTVTDAAGATSVAQVDVNNRTVEYSTSTQSAGQESSTIRDDTGDISTAQLNVDKDLGHAWAGSFPAGTHSNVVLKSKDYFQVIDNAMVLQADGRWGRMEGGITVYLQRPEGQPSSFVVALFASDLRAADVFQDISLVKEIEAQLVSCCNSFNVHH